MKLAPEPKCFEAVPGLCLECTVTPWRRPADVFCVCCMSGDLARVF